jgi:hypothetical protein
MCDATALTFGGLALSAVSQVTGFMGNRQQADQQAAANAAAERSARLSFINDSNQEALAQQEEAEQVSQRVMATNTDLAEKLATARVAAGEAGVSGLSVDAMMADYIRKGDNANTATLRQQQLDALQHTMRNKGFKAQYQSRVNAQPEVNQPSFASLALGLAVGAGKSLAGSATTDPKTGRVFVPGLDF